MRIQSLIEAAFASVSESMNNSFCLRNLCQVILTISILSVKGTINLFTEREPCPSCYGVIEQFKNQYSNVTVNIFWLK